MLDKNPETIRQYIETMIEQINKKHPNAFDEKKAEEIINMFVEQAQSDTLKEDISIYFEQELAARGLNKPKEEIEEAEKISEDLLDKKGKTFREVKAAYNDFATLLKSGGLHAYLYGDIADYLIEDNNSRDFDAIDMTCDIKDIQAIRLALVEAGKNNNMSDSITSNAGDYGFEFVFEGVPINVKPFEINDGVITQYSYDSKTQTVTTTKYNENPRIPYTMEAKGTGFNNDGVMYERISPFYDKNKGEITQDNIENEQGGQEASAEENGAEVYDVSTVVEYGEDLTPEQAANLPFSPMTEEQRIQYEQIKAKNEQLVMERSGNVRMIKKDPHKLPQAGYVDTSLILVCVMLLGVIVVALCYLFLR
jgi:hypothetical protein